MSLSAVNRVLDYSSQAGSALAALLILAHRANQHCICWPSVPTLARQLHLSERHARRLIRELEKAGQISTRPGPVPGVSTTRFLVTVGNPSITWPDEATPAQPSAIPAVPSRDGQTAGTSSSPSAEVPVPDELRTFDAELRNLPGYQPTSRFFECVLTNYASLDLVEEAIAIVDWFGTPSKRLRGKTPIQAGELCANSRILKWLRNSLDRLDARPTYLHGTPWHSQRPEGHYGSFYGRPRDTDPVLGLEERDTIP